MARVAGGDNVSLNANKIVTEDLEDAIRGASLACSFQVRGSEEDEE